MAETPGDDDLLAKLVVKCRFATEAQVRECLDEARRAGGGGASLGDLLVAKGYVTPKQLAMAEDIGRPADAGAPAETAVPAGPDTALFGKLVLLKKLANEGQVEECLKVQAELRKAGQYAKLGDILVKKAYLSRKDVEEVLRLQGKRIVRCQACGTISGVPEEADMRFASCDVCGRLIERSG